MTDYDPPFDPSPDLNLRFHARLAAHRAARATGESHSLAGIVRTRLSLRPGPIAAMGSLAAFLLFGIYLGLYHVSAPGPASGNGEIPIAENLPLLQDLGVIKNLDLLEDFDAIEDTMTDYDAPAKDDGNNNTNR